jgi:hypothetical protein
MAYVVARRNGRFEIRESVHTPSGPRARSLVGFETLSDDVIAKAERRATRPFEADAVIASGIRAGASLTANAAGSSAQFVEASRRMARALQRPPKRGRTDPGRTLIDLLGFAEAVARSQPARPFEPLSFPVLSRLVESHRAAASPS